MCSCERLSDVAELWSWGAVMRGGGMGEVVTLWSQFKATYKHNVVLWSARNCNVIPGLKASRMWCWSGHFSPYVNIYILWKEINIDVYFSVSLNLCVCIHLCLCLKSLLTDRQLKRRNEGEREEGGKNNTPKHSCPLVANCRNTSVCKERAPVAEGLLCAESGGFCLLHHLFLLKGGFDLCIHLNSKEA